MDILTFSQSVPDCRNEKNRLYDASELVFISLVAVLCGSDTWNDVEEFCEYNFKYFKERLPNLRGVPSHDTLNRFFSVLELHGLRRLSATGLATSATKYPAWLPSTARQSAGIPPTPPTV